MSTDPQVDALAVRARSALEADGRLDHEPEGEVDPELLRSVEGAIGNMSPKQRNNFLAHQVEKMSLCRDRHANRPDRQAVERQMMKTIGKVRRQLEGESQHLGE